MAVGNQQNIDLGTGVGANDAIKNYAAWVIAEANFNDIYTLLEFIGDFRYFRRDIDLNGVAGDTEWEQVANAINAAPGITVPIGYKPLWRYVKPYNTDRTAVPPIPSNYEQFFYTSVRGAGYYGTGTPPSGVAQVTMNGGLVVPLGDFVTEAQTIHDLGEIGATLIQTQVNASASELVVSGFTIFQVLRSGTLYQYQFNGEDGSYGLSWDQTNAANFIDVFDNGEIKKDLAGNAKYPTPTGVDVTLGQSNLFRTNRLTHNDAVVTIEDAATLNFEPGVKCRFKFEGTGAHTINFPLTDGATSLVVGQGALVDVEKTDNDEWTVRQVGAAQSESNIKTVSGSLTATQVKNGNTTPITINVPAPGAGKTFQGVVLRIKNNFGTVAFTNSGLYVRQIGATGNMVQIDQLDNFINAGADMFKQFTPENNVESFVENVQMEIAMQSDESTGDGSIDYELDYMIVNHL